MDKSNFILYGLAMLAVVTVIIAVKKTASCLLRIGVIMLLLILGFFAWVLSHGGL